MGKKGAVTIVSAGLLLLVFAYATSLHYRAPTHLLSGAVDESGAFRHAEEGEHWTIEATMPYRTGLSRWWNPAPDMRVRTTIESWLRADIESFKASVSESATTSPDAVQPTYAYSATYKHYMSEGDTLSSYQYDIYLDSGGAHPNAYFRTFVFDAEGNEIKLPQLFLPNSDYLSRIASTSLAQITETLWTRLRVDPTGSIFAEGLAPKEENFANFVIDEDELVLLFPPYQVAAYAAGPFEVRIPLSDFSDILSL